MRDLTGRALLRTAVLLSCAVLLPARVAMGATTDTCADCHGKDGASTETDVPVIGGVSEEYLKDAMGEYRDGTRPCPESKYRAGNTKRPATDMCKVAKGLKDADLSQAAKAFAAKPFVRAKQKPDPVKVAAGKKIHDAKCEKCHSEGGSVKDDDAGILAGQPMAYLEQTLKDYKSGKREAPKKMKPKIDELTPDEITALAHYYGSVQ